MKKIFTSQGNVRYECWEIVHVYALEEIDKDLEFDSMSHKEKCEFFGVVDEGNAFVEPGALYRTYSFVATLHHIIMFEKISYNI